MPKILLKRLHDVNPSETRFFTDPGSFIMGAQTLPENSRAVLTKTYPSDAALAKALETNQVAPEIKAILYDNESWSFTPSEEQHDLDRFEKLAADAVHRSGRLLIATPAADLVPVLNPKVERGQRYDEPAPRHCPHGSALGSRRCPGA